MRIVLSVMLSTVKSFIGGILAFKGFMLKLGRLFDSSKARYSNDYFNTECV